MSTPLELAAAASFNKTQDWLPYEITPFAEWDKKTQRRIKKQVRAGFKAALIRDEIAQALIAEHDKVCELGNGCQCKMDAWACADALRDYLLGESPRLPG